MDISEITSRTTCFILFSADMFQNQHDASMYTDLNGGGFPSYGTPNLSRDPQSSNEHSLVNPSSVLNPIDKLFSMQDSYFTGSWFPSESITSCFKEYILYHNCEENESRVSLCQILVNFVEYSCACIFLIHFISHTECYLESMLQCRLHHCVHNGGESQAKAIKRILSIDKTWSDSASKSAF